MHFCHYDGCSEAYDEWVGPSRIRTATLAASGEKTTVVAAASNFAGNWVGYWENSVGQKGKDTLVLEEEANGNLDGTWTGDVIVHGRRLDAKSIQLWAQTDTRSYRLTGTLLQDSLTLTYVAKRTDSGGSYEGKASFTKTN
jgi:hypothetical protein